MREILFLIGIWIVPLASIGQFTWSISNVPGDGADFLSIEEAIADASVSAGDLLEIHPSAISYGDVTLNKAVQLRGLLAAPSESLQPRVGQLTIPASQVSPDPPIQVERLFIDSIKVEASDVTIAHCRIGPLLGEGAHSLYLNGNWFVLGPEDSITLNSSDNVIIEGNLFLIPGGWAVFSANPTASVSFRHNTVVDETGTSEWVLYKGAFYNNVISSPMGRVALFDATPMGNLSTWRTFEDPENQDNVLPEELYAGNSETIERYLPNPLGPAINGGYDGEDVGFTGGNSPIDIALIPGSGAELDIPAEPVIEETLAVIGGLDITWSSSEAVDQFELQVDLGGSGFGDSQFFTGNSTGTTIDQLGEGIEVQVRMRTVRNGLVSGWIPSDPLTTLFRPPAEPVIEKTVAIIDGLDITWRSSEIVDQFELQVDVSGSGFGDSLFFTGDTTSTSLDQLGEGVEVQVRLRSVRNGLISDWTNADPLSTLFSPPAEPVIEKTVAIIDGLDLIWSSPEAVDQFELQVDVGSGFGESLFFSGDSTGTTLDQLGEGIEVQVRLRTVRNDLVSDWTNADPLSTLFGPPAEPVIEETVAIIDGLDLIWSNPEAVDQFELQVDVGTGFGDSLFFTGDSTGTTLDQLGEGVEVQVRLRTVRNGLVSDWILTASLTTLVDYDPLLYYSDLLGPGIEQYDTWFLSPWFGWFGDFEEGLILHLEHGYLYLIGSPASVFVYDFSLKMWFWTNQSYYPTLYMYQNPAQWYLYYKGTTTPVRYFYQYSTGKALREDEF